MTPLALFLSRYRLSAGAREELGIPPLPLSAAQVEELCLALEDPAADGAREGVDLLDGRVTPGITPAAESKAAWLGKVARGEVRCAVLSPLGALGMLGRMGGGAGLLPLLDALEKGGDLGEAAATALGTTILVGPAAFARLHELSRQGNPAAVSVLRCWAEGMWLTSRPPLPARSRYAVIRASGEINTDFLSPAQEAGTRDDVPLHALSILSTSPRDRDFIARARAIAAGSGLPLLFAGEVVGTGSSRKSASNSLVWWIGRDVPGVPNKRRGGVVLAAKIAPIFFNTLRGCGALPIRCPTGELREGETVEIDLEAGKVMRMSDGAELSRFTLAPASLPDEARAGGRNLLVIGRKLTAEARAACAALQIAFRAEPVPLPPAPAPSPARRHTLAQKLVGAAAGLPGAAPGEYTEPAASVVFSQDTTGMMTRQELEELACTRFVPIFIQSFCHTAAAPRSRDAQMQHELAAFVERLGGVALRPGDGIIHAVGNRFLLPHFLGTGGDSHTRFPIGISFPAGSDMVAFAASQGYLPLDMPESVLVRFKGRPMAGVTVRDLVHAVPWAAQQQGKLDMETGDRKANCFADRVMEFEGLEGLTVGEAYRFTDASAERSAAAAVFRHRPQRVAEWVKTSRAWLKQTFAALDRHPRVGALIGEMDVWLASPALPAADRGAEYSETVEVDLARVTEPLLAAPNDPDRIVTLSQAAGTAVDEVFIGSCMIDLADLRLAAELLRGDRVAPGVRLWCVPPDRETAQELARDGSAARLIAAGANLHVPGCSLCMGNQAQVATGSTVVSTSTRNFENRMGMGAKVYLASAAVAALTARLGRIPTLRQYRAAMR
jgi:aconitate hydratase 2/2-methylisocitrate dehydratase